MFFWQSQKNVETKYEGIPLKWGLKSLKSFKKRHKAGGREKDKGRITNIILNLNITCFDFNTALPASAAG